MFPDAHIFCDDHKSHRASIGSRATGSGPNNETKLPLTLRFASVGGKFCMLACACFAPLRYHTDAHEVLQRTSSIRSTDSRPCFTSARCWG